MNAKSERDKANRAYLRARGRCIRCAGQDAFTIGGRALCAECCEKERRWYAENYAKLREAHIVAERERREQRRAAGLCTQCGTKKSAGTLYALCDKCRARGRLKEESKRRGRGIPPHAERFAMGECVNCGAPPAERIGSNGQPVRICESCYQKSLRNLQKAREVQAESLRAHWWRQDNRAAFRAP